MGSSESTLTNILASTSLGLMLVTLKMRERQSQRTPSDRMPNYRVEQRNRTTLSTLTSKMEGAVDAMQLNCVFVCVLIIQSLIRIAITNVTNIVGHVLLKILFP